MAGVDELAKWLTACVDEDEAAARAATEGPWAWEATGEKDSSWAVGFVQDEDGTTLSGEIQHGDGIVIDGVCEGIDGNLADARHIARHNPAHALREVEFKRKVLAEHVPHELTPGWSICEECSEFVTSPGSYQGDEEEGEEPPDDYRRDSWPCSTVRHLAAVYSDRPGHEQATRPAAAAS